MPAKEQQPFCQVDDFAGDLRPDLRLSQRHLLLFAEALLALQR